MQGAYNSGKPGKLGDFQFWKTQGNLKYTLEIFERNLTVFRGHRFVCVIIPSNSSVDWLGETVTGAGGAGHHAP